jgi:hypothetical protein
MTYHITLIIHFIHIEAVIIKTKAKGPTPALRGVSDGVNPSVGPENINETTWVYTTGPHII